MDVHPGGTHRSGRTRGWSQSVKWGAHPRFLVTAQSSRKVAALTCTHQWRVSERRQFRILHEGVDASHCSLVKQSPRPPANASEWPFPGPQATRSRATTAWKCFVSLDGSVAQRKDTGLGTGKPGFQLRPRLCLPVCLPGQFPRWALVSPSLKGGELHELCPARWSERRLRSLVLCLFHA